MFAMESRATQFMTLSDEAGRSVAGRAGYMIQIMLRHLEHWMLDPQSFVSVHLEMSCDNPL